MTSAGPAALSVATWDDVVDLQWVGGAIVAVELVATGRTLLARTPDGPAVGVVSWHPAPSAVELRDLVVHVDHRRTGIGRQLVDAVCTTAGGPVELDVDPGNVAAHRLYVAAGFVPVATGRRGRLRMRWPA